MRCAKCGTEGIPGKKFCAECGAPLSNRCVNCGSDNASDAKFCADCGTALGKSLGADAVKRSPAKASGGLVIAAERQASEAIEGERKLVTALFADIKGSMELDAGPRPRGGARNHRSRAEVHDRSSPSLRRICRAVDWRWNLRAVRCAGRARGPSAARALCRPSHAGGDEPLLGEDCARPATCRSKRALG